MPNVSGFTKTRQGGVLDFEVQRLLIPVSRILSPVF